MYFDSISYNKSLFEKIKLKVTSCNLQRGLFGHSDNFLLNAPGFMSKDGIYVEDNNLVQLLTLNLWSQLPVLCYLRVVMMSG